MSALSRRPASGAGGRSITIPVAPEHAAGGAIAAGDKVDVLATFDARQRGARTVVLLESAEVSDVMTAGSIVMEDEAVAGITVSVSADDAARVAFAIRNADIDIVLSDGRPAGVAGATVTEREL